MPTMKTGKRFLKRLRQGWGSQSDSQKNQLLQAEHEPVPQQNTQIDAIPQNPEKDKSSQPAWLVRRRNKSSMPRPKSTGFMGDFNILSAEDDVGDTKDMAYDDYEVSRHGAVSKITANDTRDRNGYLANQGMSNGFPQTNDADIVTDFSRVQINDGEQTTKPRKRSSGNYEQTDAVSTTNRAIRDRITLTRDVSGRAAYWQKRDDDSKKPETFSNASSGVLKDWKTPSQIRQMKDEIETDKMNLFIYDSGIAQRAALWQKREDDHFAQMIINPDKEWKGPSVRKVLDTNHPEYGRPPKGSKTEKRGIKAHKHVVKEIGELCRIIAESGELQEDGTVTITFRKLFHTYIPISNKVVGILIRARKRGLLHFNGEMLYQRQDEDEVIRLFSVPDDE